MNGLPYSLSEIHRLQDSGTGDMGSVTDIDGPARFWLPGVESYTLIYARAWFVGGTGKADLTIDLDSHFLPPGQEDETGSPKQTPYDFRLWTARDIGVDGVPFNFRVPADEIVTGAWTFGTNDVLVLTWTNPNSQHWACEVGLVDSSEW